MKNLILALVLFIISMHCYGNTIYSRDQVRVTFSEISEKFVFEEVVLQKDARGHVRFEDIPYQLPPELLPELTIEQLMLFCCEHPFEQRTTWVSDTLACIILLDFNGYTELRSRPDYLNKMLDVMELKLANNQLAEFNKIFIPISKPQIYLSLTDRQMHRMFSALYLVMKDRETYSIHKPFAFAPYVHAARLLVGYGFAKPAVTREERNRQNLLEWEMPGLMNSRFYHDAFDWMAQIEVYLEEMLEKLSSGDRHE